MLSIPASSSFETGGSIHGKPGSQQPKYIEVWNGRWYFQEPAKSRSIPLEPLFDSCAWNLDELGRALGFSRRTLARIIERSIGIAGKTWLRQIRIVRACHLLREGEKIGHLARILGFRHPPDFSREFRAQVGVSPTAFLESERQRMFNP